MRAPRENELHARLVDLADSAGPWPDPLPAVIERAHEEERRGVRGSGRRPGNRWIVLSAAAATVVVLAAMVWIFNPFGGSEDPVASTASAPDRESANELDQQSKGEAPGVGGGGADDALVPPVPGCGPVPTQSGPVADVVTLSLDAPSSGQPGETVTVDARLTATADAPALSTGLPLPDVVVVQSGQIVARYDGPVPMIALSIPITAGMDQAIPQSDQSPAKSPPEITLTTCVPQQATDPGQDQASPAEPEPLPPGDYELVALIPYSVDTADQPNPEAATGTLVSAPVPFTVTK